VATSYGQTFVRISGCDGADPLVLLHGAGSTSLMWVPNIEALSEHYKTYAVDDFYGGGQSRCTKPIKNPEDLANWLDELLSALGLSGNINLVGLSYGGWLISQYALRFPDRLNKVVLLAPAAVALPIRLEVIIRAIISALPHRWFTRNFFRWMFADLVQKDNDGQMLEYAVDSIVMGKRCFTLPRMIRPTVLTDKELRSLTTPMLVLIGENERLYSAQKAVKRLRKVAPWIEAAVIPQAGHDLTIVQAEMINSKIIEFLKQPYH